MERQLYVTAEGRVRSIRTRPSAVVTLRTSRLSEQPKLVVLDAPQRVVVEDRAADAAVGREDAGLRLDLLGREDAAYRREMRVAVQQLQIARELLHAVDLAAALDLHGDGLALGVPAEDVDRADGRHVLAADQ